MDGKIYKYAVLMCLIMITLAMGILPTTCLVTHNHNDNGGDMSALTDAIAELEQRIAELEDRVSELESGYPDDPSSVTLSPGVGDDAFAAAIASYDTVILSPGTYSLSNFEITRPVTLIGNDAVLSCFIDIQSHGVTLDGLIDRSVDRMIRVAADDAVVKNCELYDFGYYAILITSCQHINILDNNIHGGIPTSGSLLYGICTQNIGEYDSERPYVDYLTIKGNTITGMSSHNAIDVHTGSHHEIKDNHIDDIAGTAIFVHTAYKAGDKVPLTDWAITDNEISNVGSGIYAKAEYSYDISDLILSDNNIQSFKYRAISVSGIEDVGVYNNNIHDPIEGYSYLTGIQLQDCSDFDVFNNTVSGTGYEYGIAAYYCSDGVIGPNDNEGGLYYSGDDIVIIEDDPDDPDPSDYDYVVTTIDQWRAISYVENASVLVEPGEYDLAGIRLRLTGDDTVWHCDGATAKNGLVGLYCNGSTLEGLKATQSPEQGIYINGDSNKLLGCEAYDNYLSGVQIVGGSYNLLKGVLSHGNYGGEHTDGIGISSGAHNELVGCVAYENSDDGIDTWKSTGNTLTDCKSHSNGYSGGDGNGFKLGPGGGNTCTRCISYDNTVANYTDNGADDNVYIDCEGL